MMRYLLYGHNDDFLLWCEAGSREEAASFFSRLMDIEGCRIESEEDDF